MSINKCEICNEDFFTKYPKQQVCWKYCRKLLKVKRDKEYRDANRLKTIEYRKKNTFWKRTCFYCNQKYVLNWNNINSKFCSRKCFHLDSKESRLWDNNPSFRNWLYIWKDRELHNYKYRLFQKNCKLLDEIIKDKYWYICCEDCWTTSSMRFEHHHIIFRSEKPKHPELHNISNIILLCIKCHNEYHKHKGKRNELVEKRKLNELFWDDVLYK